MSSVDLSDVNAILLNKAFKTYEKHGYLPLRHIRAALQQMALYPSEETLFELVQKFHRSIDGKDGKLPPGLNFEAFSHLVQAQRCGEESRAADDDMVLEAFTALGGNADRSGDIRTDLLRHVIAEEFALPIPIDKLIAEVDLDGGGTVSYDEIATFLRVTNRPWLPPGSKRTHQQNKK